MEDQVLALRSKGVEAIQLNSRVSPDDMARILNGEFHLVYMSPERAIPSIGLLTQMHAAKRICLLAIDECHCASEWGHDFRPDYSKLGQLVAALPKVPVMCLTATANNVVAMDVASVLKVNAKMFRGTVARKNLRLMVYPKQPDPADDLRVVFRPAEEPIAAYARAKRSGDVNAVHMLKDAFGGGASLVYCGTKYVHHFISVSSHLSMPLTVFSSPRLQGGHRGDRLAVAWPPMEPP
jgi:superfamily II DNA helicase RecQ